MLTLASLTVRNEFCTVVEKAGGLKFTMELMVGSKNKMRHRSPTLIDRWNYKLYLTIAERTSGQH